MSGAARDPLADAQASSRQLAADAGLLGVPEVECVNECGRWIRLGSRASCNHDPAVCDDCYPNGCPACEDQEERTLRHREHNVNQILRAIPLVVVSVDDLSDNDLRSLGHIARQDIKRAAADGIEALRRVRDILDADMRTTP